jgi:hypothetical protein
MRAEKSTQSAGNAENAELNFLTTDKTRWTRMGFSYRRSRRKRRWKRVFGQQHSRGIVSVTVCAHGIDHVRNCERFEDLDGASVTRPIGGKPRAYLSPV